MTAAFLTWPPHSAPKSSAARTSAATAPLPSFLLLFTSCFRRSVEMRVCGCLVVVTCFTVLLDSVEAANLGRTVRRRSADGVNRVALTSGHPVPLPHFALDRK